MVGSLAALLGGHLFLHRLIEWTGLYTAACWILTHYPVYRTDHPSEIVYRIKSPDQFSLEREIFIERCYGIALDLRPFDTVIDVGCNAGWFSLWLAAETSNRTRRALLIDANPAMVDEASWHLNRNSFVNHHVMHGAAGVTPETPKAIFHVYRAAAASSLLDYQPRAQLPTKGLVGNIAVPVVSVSKEWASLFDSSRVDLLKVDIEGLEIEFIRNEAAFMASQVRTAIFEWHKWNVTIAELDKALEEVNFIRLATSHETTFAGVALYRNTAPTTT